METVLISGKDFKSLREVTQWANDLVGRSVPNYASFEVKKILHFQVVPQGETFGLMLLAEVAKKSSMSSMVINMRKDLGLSKEE